MATLPDHTTARVQTILGMKSMTDCCNGDFEPWQVTRDDWTNIHRAERRRLGQRESGDNQRVPWAEYEEYHMAAVKLAWVAGKPIPNEVLADYPGIILLQSMIERISVADRT